MAAADGGVRTGFRPTEKATVRYERGLYLCRQPGSPASLLLARWVEATYSPMLVRGGHSCPPRRLESSQILGLIDTDFLLFQNSNGYQERDRSVRATQAMQFVSNKYEYQRRLPHYQKFDRTLFVTFCTLNREPLSAEARDAVLRHCRHDHGRRYVLHAVVVMPEHVHLLLTPLRDPEGQPYALPSILKALKGASAREINKSLRRGGPVWQEESFDHVFRGDESFAEKLEYARQNPVRRGLVSRPEDYRWLWVEDTGNFSRQSGVG